MTANPLALVSVVTGATTYRFQTAGPGFRSWAICTVNDVTGELLITSDWGNWSHRWNVDHLGTPSLTAFIGDRDEGAVDYIAGKLQGRRGGQRFSAKKTVAAWKKVLCERRLEVGRRDIERGRPPRTHGLTKEAAREIWNDLCDLVDDCGDSADLVLSRVCDIHGFTQYVDDTPYESLETEQTPEDRALREQILPSLIAACADVHRGRVAGQSTTGASP